MIVYSSNHDDKALLNYVGHTVQTSQFEAIPTRAHDTSAGNLPNTARILSPTQAEILRNLHSPQKSPCSGGE